MFHGCSIQKVVTRDLSCSEADTQYRCRTYNLHISLSVMIARGIDRLSAAHTLINACFLYKRALMFSLISFDNASFLVSNRLLQLIVILSRFTIIWLSWIFLSVGSIGHRKWVSLIILTYMFLCRQVKVVWITCGNHLCNSTFVS